MVKFLVSEEYFGEWQEDELGIQSVIIDGNNINIKIISQSKKVPVDKKTARLILLDNPKGWFENTMPNFKEPILVAYIDVDLESSTKTCIKYLYPLLVSGGVLFSQDGHLPWVIKILNDENFWEKEVGYKKPKIDGLGKKKLLMIRKE